MTHSFLSSATFHSFVLVSAVSLALGACHKPPTESQKKEVDRILEEMKGPDVPSVDSALLESARDAEESRNFSTAAQYYKQLFDSSPENSVFKLHLADNLRRSGKNDEAVEIYQELLKDEEYKLDAMEGIGLGLMAEAEFEEAGDMLADVMEQDTTRWRTINAIGILFTIKGMYPEARQYFAEALVQSPKNVSVLNNLGLMEAFAEEYDAAIRELSTASKQARGDKRIRLQADLNMALVYAIMGDLKMAERTAAPHLTETQLLNNMGYYAHLADDDNLAKSYLNMALTASNKHYEKAWENLETLNKLIENTPKKR